MWETRTSQLFKSVRRCGSPLRPPRTTVPQPTLLRLTSNRLVRAPWAPWSYMPQHVWQSLTANFFFLRISFLDRTCCHNVLSQSLSGEVYSKIGCPLFSWSRRKLRPPLPVVDALSVSWAVDSTSLVMRHTSPFFLSPQPYAQLPRTAYFERAASNGLTQTIIKRL